MTKYETWQMEDGYIMFPSTSLEYHKKYPEQLLVKKPFEFEAATGEEANAIHNLRMGFGAYKPMGEPKPCPKCAAWFYPLGSGECWHCGKIC